MNFIAELIANFQDLVARVPEFVQPLIVALAGAVPFIEGEGAATIGIIGGINPVIAAIAAIIGNFVCVALLVLLSSGARNAVKNRAASRQLVHAGGGLDDAAVPGEADVYDAGALDETPRSQKFVRALDKYGVPGVSLLGPLLLPTQFTATTLAAIGVAKGRILFWQAIAIIGWTTLLTIFITVVINAAR